MFPRFIILGLAVVIATTGVAQAQLSPGDMNCNGTKDGLDVAPFVLALIDPTGYGMAYPDCELSSADFDCDGGADTGDVDGFVTCLLTGNCPPCSPPGDMNCDGTVNGLDVAPFVLGLIDPTGYGMAYPDCELSSADFDCDGGADPDDIEGFVDCLLTGNCPPCPPPTGSCCQADGTCAVTTQAECLGVWTMYGTCNPNPCSPPGMVLIPAGEFLMGNSFDPEEGYSDELPRHAVYVDAFYMDTCEVTNQQYADGLNWAKNQGNLITVISGVVCKYNTGISYPYCSTTSAPTGYPHYGEYSRITWDDTTFGVTSGKESHPMVMVSWYGSVAYANWRSGMLGKPLSYDLSDWTGNFGSGYRLPTEAEWEKAARGGTSGHRFPWSDTDTIQHALANYYSSSSYSYDTSPTRGYHPAFSDDSTPYTSPVGYFAANGYGLYDMAGNVSEWCNDWYDETYYSSSPYNNPPGPASGTYRVLRCGSWYYFALYGRCAYRDLNSPGYRYHNHGFRLALDSE